MFKHLSASLAIVLTAVCLKAQTHPEGNYANYPFPEFREVKPPAGYKPFYISQLSRHGSRFELGGDIDPYEYFHNLFTSAAKDGTLTAQGVAFLEDFESLYQEARGHSGQLTGNGRKDLRRIAGNLYRRFPEVFDGETRIEAISTGYTRTVQSLDTFCGVLDSLDSSLSVSVLPQSAAREALLCWDFSKPHFHHTDDEFIRSFATAPWAERYDSLLCAALEKDDIFARFFTRRPDGAGSKWFLKKLYSICACDIGRDPASTMLRDYLSEEELRAVWQALNYRYYNIFGQGALDGGRHWALMYPLLRDFLDKACADISSGNCNLRLRFAHDSQLNPLLVLMGEARFAEAAASDSDVDRCYDWGFAPMASNILFVFYRGKKGPVLVRVLLNDEDVSLPLKARKGVYYDWEELKAYLGARIEEAVSICKARTEFDVRPVWQFRFNQAFPGTEIHGSGLTQGMAIWDGMMFSLRDSGSCVVFDLSKDRPAGGFRLGSHSPDNHANVAFFGGQRYDPSDRFPLLYVSQAKKDRLLYVERILTDAQGMPTGSELVQTIRYKSSERTSGLFAADSSDPGLMYCYGNTVGNCLPGNRVKVSTFRVPAFDRSKPCVELTDEDALDCFYTDQIFAPDETAPHKAVLQGGTVTGGVLVLCTGSGREKHPSRFFFIDLKKRDGAGIPYRAASCEIQSSLPFEMEDIDVYDGKLYLSSFRTRYFNPVVSFDTDDFWITLRTCR